MRAAVALAVMSHRRSALVLVAAALLIGGALVVWLDRGQRGRAASRDTQGSDGGAARVEAPLESELVDGEPNARDADARRAVASEAASETPYATNAAGEDRPCRVLVAVERTPWLRDRWRGRLTWTDARGAAVVCSIDDGSVSLPGTPRSHEEFTALSIASFAAEPLALAPLVPTAPSASDARRDGKRDARFELRAALAPGATVDWAPSVPHESRTRVDVAIGGRFPPSRVTGPANQPTDGSVDRASETLLPLLLPLAVEATSVWVAAPGSAWRAFALAPTTERIEVALVRSASLRVRHDGQVGAEVVVSVRHVGSQTRAAIVDASDVDVVDVPPTLVRVWIEKDGQPLSHTVDLELAEGEARDVDLRAAAALDGRGGLRVVVRATADVLATSKQPLGIFVRRGAQDEFLTRDQIVGSMRRAPNDGSDAVFELDGLAPGRHALALAPFGACTEVDVRAGEVVATELSIEHVGFVQFEPPPELPKGALTWSIEGVASDSNATTKFSSPRAARAGDPYALVCGTYQALVAHNHDGATTRLESEPFVVLANSTTVVPLTVRPVSKVDIHAIDARSGAPIAFDVAFWVRVRAFDLVTNAELRLTADFHGADGAYTGLTWALPPRAGRVRIEPPPSPFWTFEPLDAVEFTDGATITLRATAK